MWINGINLQASKFADVDKFMFATFDKKTSSIVGQLGLAKLKSGVVGHGSVYEMIFQHTEKGQVGIAEPLRIRVDA